MEAFRLSHRVAKGNDQFIRAFLGAAENDHLGSHLSYQGFGTDHPLYRAFHNNIDQWSSQALWMATTFGVRIFFY